MNRETGYFLLIVGMPFAFAIWWEWAQKRDDKRRAARDAEYLGQLGRMLALHSTDNAFGQALSAAFTASLRRKDVG